MDYNTTRKKLLLPEYGRNIQTMVDQMMEIPDKDERTRCAFAIIDVMSNMYPNVKDIQDFSKKLWDHLTIMTDFNIDVDGPFPKPTPEEVHPDTERLAYPSEVIRIKHYGKNIENLIEIAINTEDKKERDQLSLLIANHMKKSFLAWNKDVVNNEKIYKDLYTLSHGKLDYNEKDFKLMEAKMIVAKPKKKKNPNKQQNKRY